MLNISKIFWTAICVCDGTFFCQSLSCWEFNVSQQKSADLLDQIIITGQIRRLNFVQILPYFWPVDLITETWATLKLTRQCCTQREFRANWWTKLMILNDIHWQNFVSKFNRAWGSNFRFPNSNIFFSSQICLIND